MVYKSTRDSSRMSVLASILLHGSLLGIFAIVATGITYHLTHGPARAARSRWGLQRQRERQRREYWGYE